MILRRSSSQVQVQDYLIVVFTIVGNVPIPWERTLCLPGIQMMWCAVVNCMNSVLKRILRQMVLHALSSVGHNSVRSFSNTEHDVTMDQYHSQIGSNTHETSSSKNMNNATDQDSESCNCSSVSHQLVPPKWTRYYNLASVCRCEGYVCASVWLFLCKQSHITYYLVSRVIS